MSRAQEYAEWTAEYVARHDGYVRGLCRLACDEMVARFPELRLAAGLAHCSQGQFQHWWCVAPDGAIVDPTAAQFPGPIDYEELDPRSPTTLARVPTGRCLDCGGDTYYFRSFCDDACEKAFTASLQAEAL